MVVAALVLHVVDPVAGEKRSHSMRKFENSSNAALSLGSVHPLKSKADICFIRFSQSQGVARFPRALGLLHFQVRGGDINRQPRDAITTAFYIVGIANAARCHCQ
jgi:hypothetical protein